MALPNPICFKYFAIKNEYACHKNAHHTHALWEFIKIHNWLQANDTIQILLFSSLKKSYFKGEMKRRKRDYAFGCWLLCGILYNNRWYETFTIQFNVYAFISYCLLDDFFIRHTHTCSYLHIFTCSNGRNHTRIYAYRRHTAYSLCTLLLLMRKFHRNCIQFVGLQTIAVNILHIHAAQCIFYVDYPCM